MGANVKEKHNQDKPTQNMTVPAAGGFTHDELVEIQAEAYYRALKRIENEKITNENSDEFGQIKEKTTKLKLVLIFLFTPKKLNKMQNNFADSFLADIVRMILDLIGLMLRSLPIMVVISGIWTFYKIPSLRQSSVSIATGIITILLFLLLSLVIACFGGFFSASAEEVSNTKNYEKLYAYSASMMSNLAMVIALITFVITLRHK